MENTLGGEDRKGPPESLIFVPENQSMITWRLHLLTLWTQHDWIRKLIFNHMLFPQVKEVSDNAHVGPT